MTAVAGLFAAASLLVAPLPPLPPQGLVVSQVGGLKIVSLSGRTLAQVKGLRFASEYALNSGLPRFRDRQGRLWALDHERHRFVPATAGLPLAGGTTLLLARKEKAWLVLRKGRVALRMRIGHEFPFLSEDRDVVSTGRRALDLRSMRFLRVPSSCMVASRRAVNWVLLCGRIVQGTLLPTSIEELVGGRRRRVAGPAAIRNAAPRDPAGYWVFVRVAADRRTLLAQWSGECESPAAFIVQPGSKPRPAGGPDLESVAAGWSRHGRAIVHFTAGICGRGFHGGPGIYAVGRDRKPQLIVTIGRLQRFAFWG